MPELPEVETIRRTIAPRLVGATVEAVEIRSRDVIGHPGVEAFASALPGGRFVQVGRRGKYLLLALGRAGASRRPGSPAAAGLVLVIHLRMTGRLVVASGDDPEYPHTHVAMRLDHGRILRFSDVRRFGRLYLYPRADLPPALLAAAGLGRAGAGAGTGARVPPGLFALGPEPLGVGFGAAYLRERLRGRGAPIKAALLDQAVVAGLGNIYVDEALFRAGVHPATPARDLNEGALVRIVRAVRRVLRDAIDARGTTLSDYIDGRGVPGEMRRALRVYGRAGEPCRRCGTPIAGIRIAGRGTHVCPRCQPRASAVSSIASKRR